MKSFHVISGLPRSGSTLLCNILNQNAQFKASTTSIIPQLLNGTIHIWSNSLEMKGLLNRERDKTEERMHNALKSFVEEWYSVEKKDVIFDKSRGWALNSLMLHKLYPDAKLIVMVRDLRNVFASIEKQHQKNPLFDETTDPAQKTIYHKADTMLSKEGVIGSPIIGIEDLIRRKTKNTLFIKYEDLASDPEKKMKELYSFINIPYFDHQFNNVINTAIDPDAFYLNKYPHKGEGKVVPCDPNEWKAYFSSDLAQTIINRFADYNKYFKYE